MSRAEIIILGEGSWWSVPREADKWHESCYDTRTLSATHFKNFLSGRGFAAG
jgi:hypothetical protein